MRTLPLLVLASLALAACGQSATPDPAASTAPEGVGAITNATVGPVPSDTVAPSPAPTASQAPTGAAATPMPASAPASACGADKAGKFIGKAATPDLRAQVIEAVGHNRIRWIGPDTVVTMDFSESRLNADLDAADKIEGFRCG